MSYVDQIQTAQATFDQLIHDTAERARQEVIIPFCKEHGLDFYSGMGTWFFAAPDSANISDAWDAQEAGYDHDTFEEIFKVLRLEVTHNSDLGDWMEGYQRNGNS